MYGGWFIAGGIGHVCLIEFSAKFPIGLHVILQTQIEMKFKTVLNHMRKVVLTKNPLKFNLELLFK